ncbi:MAG: M56 family metallopeptidase, partial [Lachnospiraceae bacterium]|nr:M56 family metallopeptidase [Lachnospiraceae bacterium]
MSLIQMSAAAGILILGIVLFRSLLVHRLPKKVMILLWEIAILRLLLPLAVPIPLDIPEPWADARSLVANDKAYHVTITTYDGHFGEMKTQEIANISFDETEGMDASTVCGIVYLLGTAVMLLGSVFLYVRDSRLFKEGLPMPEQEKERLIALAAKEEKDKQQLREIRFQTSDRTATPVTYGVIRPAIVFPKGFSLREDEEISFCLRHEWVHIKHHDNLKKLIAHLALCVHWFNPFVWVMYLLFNRDMELLCDETVVRHSGGERREYAMTLLSMASCRGLGFGTGLGFGKNAVKERIVAVMTFKKTTLLGVLAAVFAISMALTVFFVTNSEAYAMRLGSFDVSEADSG